MPLDDKQSSIVEESPDSKILVTAGPGTGKTHVLIARLAALIDKYDIAPGQDLLVLTFSRAAVREIRTRLSATNSNARYVRARTFDSFATLLLMDLVPDGSWASMDYDGRIVEATRLLLSSPQAKARVADYAHICVDEIQDLVAERAEFVKAILENGSGGFTLLGDPAQGIYNFQLKDPVARKEGSAALYKWLRKKYSSDLHECSLETNYRAETDEAKKALWAGALLNHTIPNYPKIKYDLETVVSGLSLLCDYTNSATVSGAFARTTAGTAILCFDNGQALMIARKLHELGIPHALQREAVDRVVPAWVGALFNDFEHKQIGKSSFITRAEGTGYSSSDALAFWRLLKKTDRRTGDSINLDVVAEKIRCRNLPDELCDNPTSAITVSTIHRAKGLEFKRVVIIQPRMEQDDELTPEEARVMYVALTRPRRELRHMSTPGFRGLYKHRDTDRWIRKFGWKIADVEVRGEDIHRDDPAGGFPLNEARGKEIQAYILSSVKRGDPVILRQISKLDEKGRTCIYYRIEHNGRFVGVTSEMFGAILYKILKISPKWNVKWPEIIEGLTVDAVDTVAGTEASGRRCGLGVTGIWLRVRVSGLGNLHFIKG